MKTLLISLLHVVCAAALFYFFQFDIINLDRLEFGLTWDDLTDELEW